jgi:hypothetical protein
MDNAALGLLLVAALGGTGYYLYKQSNPTPAPAAPAKSLVNNPNLAAGGLQGPSPGYGAALARMHVNV